MENLERQPFEMEWKKAFEGAEVGPSDQVWTNIELGLTKAENAGMKRSVVFYQRLAAASVIVIFLGGLWLYYYSSKEEPKKVTEQIAPANTQQELPDNTISAPNEKVLTEKGPVTNLSVNEKNMDARGNTQGLYQPAVVDAKNEDVKSSGRILREPPSNSFGNNELKGESIADIIPGEVDPDIFIYPLPPAHRKMSRKRLDNRDYNKNESLWASMGISGSTFTGSTANSTSAAFMDQSSFSSTVGQSSRGTHGTAFSAGFSIGMRVSRRWLVQGGLGYMNQNFDYNSNLLSYNSNSPAKVATAEFANHSDGQVTTTTPYTINSTIEYISIPIQAGYMVVDRKFGLQLNAGLSPDIFVRNVLLDESGRLESVEQGPGADSPYKSTTIAALFGTEVSYKVGKQYRFSLAPGFRYSLTSAYKPSTSSESNHLVIDLGFRFRYIFQ